MSQRPNRLDATFARLRAAGELGLFPYLTAGFPDLTTCATLLDAIAESGADGLELGIPFSDPLADGVTLQRASAKALEGNFSLRDALGLVRGLRQRHQLPVVIMSYLNPLLAYGLPELCQDAAAAGVDGFIVPDLSLEEAPAFQAACASAGLHYVYMAAPTSGEDRLANVGGRAGGFVYCVALVGTTGARTSLSTDLPEFLARVRGHVSAPLVVGFGISTSAHVSALVGKADGVIVASALADLIERTEPEHVGDAVRAAVRELKGATRTEATAGAR
jgi:tryptophan synthase alpha chain